MNRASIPLTALLLSLVAGPAFAICSVFTSHFRVGADATNCTHNDIQSAINAVGSCPIVIDITREHLYQNQHLTIAGKNVTLQGWGDGVTCQALNTSICEDCGPGQTTPLVTLDGGGSGGPVLSIGGASNVTLRNLTVAHGATGYGGSGGGIAFSGTGSLALAATTLANNYAYYGGAINLTAGALAAGGTSATLTLGAYTQLINNTAQLSGGGIRIEGPARLFAHDDYTVIEFNHALGVDPLYNNPSGGFGGGIEIIGPARADIGSPGYNAAGIVSNNDGIYGAGVAVVDNGNGEAVLRLFAQASGRPAVIADNTFARQGGGVYLSGLADLCMFGAGIVRNHAEDGAAIWFNNATYYPNQLAKGIFVNVQAPDRLGTECGPEVVDEDGGALDCASTDANCNAIDGNSTQHPDTSPAPGAIVRTLDTEGYGGLTASRVRLQGNTGASLINFGGLGESATLHRCLISDNVVDDSLILGGDLHVHACTLAHDSIGSGHVFDLTNGSLDLLQDIIDEVPNITYASHSDFSINVGYLLTNSVYNLPADNPSIIGGSPKYVDAAHGDYHLAPLAQVALDFGTPNGGVFEADLDGNGGVVDLPGIANYFYGSPSADLGAYERQNLLWCGTNDSLFCDGFDHSAFE